MDHKSFSFKVPPPPPPTKYIPKPPLPPPPAAPPLVQPPPPPPPTATPQNWNVIPGVCDFSRPPPSLYPGNNGLSPTMQGYVQPNSVPITNLSPGTAHPAQTNTGYYGVNNQDNSHFYGNNNRQYTQRRYRQELYTNTHQGWRATTNFKKPRYENRIEQDIPERNYYRNDSRYPRNPVSSDSRSSYSREAITNDTVISTENKHQEDGHRGRKRKKPLSQAVPAKRAWTDEEAQEAIEVEKEYNKLFKNHSLKIKFPDQELNREIVSKFHNSIETVYFQQPSNPRFCFVTLQDGADPNAVIEELNKIQFGLGYLSAEYKKDREDEQVVGPDDIDPLTLYVGNLAQEVTKEDMVSFYPKNKRIDIGFAKKMRYTRYAFVSFKSVKDSIQAFKDTHYADLHSKSMIVRFRRLHGTVGMPGEPKIQQSPKEEMKKKDTNSNDTPVIRSESAETNELIVTDSRTTSESSDTSSNFDASLVKSEPYDYPDGDYDGYHSEDEDPVFVTGQQQQEPTTTTPTTTTVAEREEAVTATIVKQEPEFITPFLPEMPDFEFPVRPIPLKVEPDNEDGSDRLTNPEGTEQPQDFPNGFVEPKKEDEADEILEPVNPEDNEEEFNRTTDFGSLLDNFSRRPNFFP